MSLRSVRLTKLKCTDKILLIILTKQSQTFLKSRHISSIFIRLLVKIQSFFTGM